VVFDIISILKMKILSLNIWNGGILADEVKSFLLSKKPDIDVLCLQETEEPSALIIADFAHDFTIRENRRKQGEYRYDLTMLVRNTISIDSYGVLLDTDTDAGCAQWMTLKKDGRIYFVANVHGVPHPGDKFDTSERLNASNILIQEGEKHEGIKIFMGDFNLNEHSESVALFERNGYRNLIKEYNIETTRNHHCWDRYDRNRPQLHSDYAFVSPQASIKHFEVFPDIVSDHQPLFLEVV
jgi:endonuclease/exonuclease/phosphatase (EEP) superfamily protein YafD